MAKTTTTPTPDITWHTETRTLGSLIPYSKNPRKITKARMAKLMDSIAQDGYHARIAINTDNTIAVGHQRRQAMLKMGWKPTDEVEVLVPNRTLNPEEFDRVNIRDNIDFGEFDMHVLTTNHELATLVELGVEGLQLGDGGTGAARAKLGDKFGVPPFSVLDGRQGYWQDRKQQWLAYGIESELGREGMDATVVQTDWMQRGNDSGGSVFDPVLVELACRWFCPPGAAVLDPFAGGSVRGVVAALLGMQYYGIELRPEQVAANQKQANAICADVRYQPFWEIGDSRKVLTTHEGEYDLLFSCPPYADLEVYSDEPADISNMPYPEFLEAYRAIIAGACARLREDRFAVWVIGDVRDSQGRYRGLVPDTIKAFQDAGLSYYNEAVLLTPIGSMPMRAGRPFTSARKLAKGHQNVLVFCKGNPKKATAACGKVEVDWGAAAGGATTKPDAGE